MVEKLSSVYMEFYFGKYVEGVEGYHKSIMWKLDVRVNVIAGRGNVSQWERYIIKLSYVVDYEDILIL